MDKDKAYKIFSYDCWKMYTDEDMFGCRASFDTLEEAVAYCRQKMDDQIEDDIKRAEAGELTTAEQIKEARSQVSTYGMAYHIHNDADPKVKSAFSFLDYIEQRLSAIVEQRRMQQ